MLAAWLDPDFDRTALPPVAVFPGVICEAMDNCK
jgi:hypothetical protein